MNTISITPTRRSSIHNLNFSKDLLKNFEKSTWYSRYASTSPTTPFIRLFTVRSSSCGKVMFLHLSVILFTGRGSSMAGSGGGACVGVGDVWQGVCSGGVHGRGEGVHGRGRWQGVHGRGEGMHGRGCMAGGCACVAWETATAADDTRRTGMHSCSLIILSSYALGGSTCR